MDAGPVVPTERPLQDKPTSIAQRMGLQTRPGCDGLPGSGWGLLWPREASSSASTAATGAPAVAAPPRSARRTRLCLAMPDRAALPRPQPPSERRAGMRERVLPVKSGLFYASVVPQLERGRDVLFSAHWPGRDADLGRLSESKNLLSNCFLRDFFFFIGRIPT